MTTTWPELLAGLVRRVGPDAPRPPAGRCEQILARRGDLGPAGGVRGRAAQQGRDGHRADRPGRRDAGVRHPDHDRRARRSTWSAPAATGRTRSTSPPWPRSSPRRPGATVVKHGNRAASSACGAADVLEALGVVLDLTPQAQQQVVEQVGIGFLFAPLYHPALRHAGPTRARAGHPHHVQLPRPAGQPGPAGGPGGRGRRRADGRADGRGVRRPRPPGSGGARRRRSGRADHDHHLDRVGLRRRAAVSGPSWTRLDLGLPRAEPGRSGRRRPGAATPRWSATCWPASPDRSATSCC